MNNISDLSIIAFIKVIASISRKSQVLEYNENEKLIERMPNYKVKLGFGLHSGWAIEGAIGSEFKIDASYLSPNVNIASRLEAATKQYGVSLLISSDLIHSVSDRMFKFCREIDRVTLKGSNKHIGLFTIDFDLSCLAKSIFKNKSREKKRHNHEMSKYVLNAVLATEKYQACDLFEFDKVLKIITLNDSREFNLNWKKGFQLYIKGNWKEACEVFNNKKFQGINDGPTQTLLTFMKNHKYSSPNNWNGYRSLNEK